MFRSGEVKSEKTGNRKWAGAMGKAALAVSAAIICLMTGRDTRGIGTAQVQTSKSIPEATVALIDPESGTSMGGGSTDVNIAVGDIISFRIHFSAIPDNDLRGIQGYLTEYIPRNTEVVGVRILDRDGNTLMPRPPGLAPDGCGLACWKFNSVPCDNSVDGCTGGTRSLEPGSISQVHGDTGFFFAVDERLVRYPGDRFITSKNGILMDPEPNSVGRIAMITGIDSPFYAHAEWDWSQVQGYGTGDAACGGQGSRSTPYMYGSPVAGPESFYIYEATEVLPGVIQFNDEIGPWERIFYPGSRIGFGDPATGSGSLARTSQPTTLGWDVTPNNPLPVTAIRAAVGAVHPGEPGIFEIALRVLDLPLDPDQGQDVNCSEVFSSEVAGDAARHNSWPFFLPSPGCVYLNLKFDLDVDKELALSNDLLFYTISGKNLSINDQHNVVIKQKYDQNTVAFVNADGGGFQAANCDGDGFNCVIWELGDLAPADEYSFYSSFTVGGTGHRLVPMVGVYESDELPSPGFSTNAVTVIRAAPIIKVDMENPQTGTAQGGTAYVNGLFTNDGTGASTWNTLFFLLPQNWTIVPGSVRLGGIVLSCENTGTSTPSCTMNRDFSIGQTEEITFELNVPAEIPNGLYDIDFRITNTTQAFGSFETYFQTAVTVPVGANRSDPPVITCPIDPGALTISGTTDGPDGTHIRVYFNSIQRDEEQNAIGGAWEVSTFPTTFGEFYGGLEARATAQAPGELESEVSNTCETGGWSGLPQCSDGIDNDGDGWTDFPYDPGCEDPWDDSEEDREPYDYTGIDLPACWDGIDHDGDGLTDFPDDPGCISWFDESEENFVFPDDDLKARLLIVFDTSGSMNWHVCDDVFTGGDGSEECPGWDVGCDECESSTCDDGLPNDSRMYKAKEGLRMAVSAYGNVEWALMRFHQRAEEFICPGEYASLRGGGWQGAGAAPCVGDFNTGDLLVRFAPHNAWHILQWMNHSSNYPGGDPPPGLDWELRGSGTTPLAGSLNSAYEYLIGVKDDDAKVDCREYRVILVTDGEETCGGDPVEAAAALFSQGLPVHVVGFATHHQSMIDNLNAIAEAGGTGSAVFADDSIALSAAISQIVSDSIIIELCNDEDDNCDGVIDGGFPLKGEPCDDGQLGICKSTGIYVCSEDGRSVVCEITDPGEEPREEECNGLDDDCDGIIDNVDPDEYPYGCNPPPDLCDPLYPENEGLDDPRVGQPCGSDIGECETGITICENGHIVCEGAVGPQPEVCDGRDNNCNGITDGLIEICYTFDTGCGYDETTQTWHCEGICNTGFRRCPTPEEGGTGEWGPCEFEQGPMDEICDGRDNNCNGMTDEDEFGAPLSRECYPPGSGLQTGCMYDEDIGQWNCLGECSTGQRICTNGVWGDCEGYVIPSLEICDGLDNNCNGLTDEPENLVGLGQPCGSAIGRCTQGIMDCIDGQEVCVGGEGPFPGDCNGMDDNCDGVIDDPDEVGHLEGHPCGTDVGECEPGETKCVGGEIICVGGRQPTEEVCNGLDDDCDGVTDNGAVCPPNSYCYDGACRPVCDPGDEFGCPINSDCVEVFIDILQDYANICLPSMGDCGGETCPEGWVCIDDECVDPCESVECEPWEECVQGVCMDRSCTAFGIDCPPGEFCFNHECVADPCADADCNPETDYCLRECDESGCTYSCEPLCACPPGQRCTMDGDCVEDPCSEIVCTGNDRCNPETGECEPDNCFDVTCSTGDTCYNGECIDDPCAYADCPPFHECVLVDSGENGPIPMCAADQSFWDPSLSTKVTAGKGGCGCRTTGSSSPVPGALLVFLLLLLLLRSSRSPANKNSGRRGG